MKFKPIFLFSLFLVSLLVVSPFSVLQVPDVKAQEEEWTVIERGDSFIRRQNVANPGLYSWESAPQWIWDGNAYVPYIYWRDEAKKCYVVQSALIAAEIYDTGIAKFFDPSLTEERVKSEIWQIWADDGGVWKEASLSSTITFNVIQTETSVIIEVERTTSKPNGILMVRFVFREGSALKHDVIWTSNNVETETIEVNQVWDLKLSTAQVVLDDGNLVTTSTTTNSTTYLFGDSENDFLVLESQWSATYYPDGTLRENERFETADIDLSGKKITYTFGNWTLIQGESLEIDPDTQTTLYPTADAYFWQLLPDDNWGSATVVDVQTSENQNDRTFLKFDLSSISSGATITLAKLRLYCYHIDSLVAGVTDVEARQVADDSWTELGITWNNQPDYGAVEDTQVPAVGWVEWTITDYVQDENDGDETISICLKSKVENYDATVRHSRYRSREYDGGSTKPELYIEYTPPPLPPTIGEFQAPNTVYANQYFYLNTTIDDKDGVEDFDYATIEINDTIILKWIYDIGEETYHFSEYSDPSSYCTLDIPNSIKADVNSTAYKLSWRIKLVWAYPEGSISVISTNTKIFDDGGASGSGSHAGLFTFEEDLIIHTDAAVDDSHVDPNDEITFTGTVYYQGTSTVPEDTTGIVVYMELSGITKGSDTSVIGGSYSIPLSAESTINQHDYNVYSYTDQTSETNRSVSVIVDRLIVTISANTTNPVPDACVNFTLTAIYDYDDNPVTSWTVNSYRNSTHFATGNFTDINGVGTLYYYTTENVTESTHGLTAFTSNTVTVYWSGTFALTIKTLDLDDGILLGTIVFFNNGTEYEIAVNGNGLATLSDITGNTDVTVKVKWQNVWVNGTWVTNMTTTKTIDTPCNVWEFTINAKDAGGTILSLSPTNFIWLFPNATEVNQTRVDGSWSFKIMNGTHHYRTQYQGQWVSANVTLPVIDKNVTIINKNCWVYSLTTYVQTTADSPAPHTAITGVSLTLLRTSDSTTLNGLYGLSSDFKTTGWNTTHAKYIWTQLTNQTSLYTITASVGGAASPQSTSTSLTEDTETLIQLFYPVGGGEGGPPGEPSENGEEPSLILPEFPEVKITTFADILKDPNVWIPIGVIAALSCLFAVTLMGWGENRKKSKKRKKGLNQDKDGYLPKYKPK